MDLEDQPQEIRVDSLNLARRIGLYNSVAIYYNKNKWDLLDSLKQKELSDQHEKFEIIIKTNYPKTVIELILAKDDNRSNHQIMLLDVELIQQTLIEGLMENEHTD